MLSTAADAFCPCADSQASDWLGDTRGAPFIATHTPMVKRREIDVRFENCLSKDRRVAGCARILTPAMATESIHCAERRKLLSSELGLVPWFGMLDCMSQRRVRRGLIVGTLRVGEPVITAGHLATHWHGVLDGLLRISGDFSTTLSGLPPGAWFGEGPLLKREPYRFDVTALRASQVVFMPGDLFQWLLDHCVAFNRYVMCQLHDRLDQFIAAREIDRIANPDTRVARSLWALFDAAAMSADDPMLRLTQHELAVLVGLSRQRVNEALKLLESRRLIDVEYSGLRLLDLDALQHGDAAGLARLRARKRSRAAPDKV